MKLLDPSLRAKRGASAPTLVGLTLSSVALFASGVRGDGEAANTATSAAPVVATNASSNIESPDAAPMVSTGTSLENDSTLTNTIDVALDEHDARNEVLADALAYLVAHQQEDGSWLAAQEPGGSAGEFDDLGVTAAIVLALVEAGEDADFDGRTAALARGIDWIAGTHREETGAFALSDRGFHLVPSHALALQAWVAAFTDGGLAERETPWLETARAAAAFAERARNPYMGWRYDCPPAGDNDSVMTSWMLMALASARDAGVEIEVETSRGGLGVLDEFTDPATGRIGYAEKGQATSRLARKAESHPGVEVEFPTALGVQARLDWGADPIEENGLLASAVLVATKPPRWSRGHGTIDSYYWQAGTEMLASFGGVMAERWNHELENALLGHFDRDDEGRVFWAAVDAWHDEGNEVAMTAWCVRALLAASE